MTTGTVTRMSTSRSKGTEQQVCAAIDIGASGGRVIAGWIADRRISTDVVHRFDNGPVERPDGLRWDIRRLYDEVITGLAKLAERYPRVISVGIDTWAV